VTARQPLPTAPSDRFRRKPLVETAGELFQRAPLAPKTRGWLKDLYHALLMWQTGNRGLASTLPHGEVVRALPKHRHLSWNPAEYEAFRSAVTPGATVVDVGANVGQYSMLFGQWVGPTGAVFAFEPSPAAFEGLVRHIAMNGLESVVTPIDCAVGAEATTARLIVAGTGGESRLAAAFDADAATLSVPVTTIDAFCRDRRITPGVIKVDVEGFELAVLRGARETIRRAGPSLALFVEMHPSIWPLVGTSKADMLAELDAQSLEIVPHKTAEDVWGVEGLSVRVRRR